MASNLPSVPAAFGVVKYLYAQAQEIFADYSYGGLIPIVPIQDEPALIEAIQQGDGISYSPYIVYTYYGNGLDANYFCAYDQLVLVVKSQDQKAERQLLLLIQKLFARWAESGQAVNKFIATQNDPYTTAPFTQEYLDFDYKYTAIWASTGGTPGTMENEPVHAQVVVRVGYTWAQNDEPLP